jgi:hypothetical protein
MGLGAKTNWLAVNRLSQSNSDSEVRSEKLVAEPGDISGIQRKGNVIRWKPLPSNG